MAGKKVQSKGSQMKSPKPQTKYKTWRVIHPDKTESLLTCDPVEFGVIKGGAAMLQNVLKFKFPKSRELTLHWNCKSKNPDNCTCMGCVRKTMYNSMKEELKAMLTETKK